MTLIEKITVAVWIVCSHGDTRSALRSWRFCSKTLLLWAFRVGFAAAPQDRERFFGGYAEGWRLTAATLKEASVEFEIEGSIVVVVKFRQTYTKKEGLPRFSKC